MLQIQQATTPAELDAVRELVREYTSWAFTLGPAPEEAPAFVHLDEELASLPGIYGPPDGRFLLATHEGQAVGCLALRRHDATTAEVKRLYVRPSARGLKLGETLIARLLDEARALGYRRIILDSHHTMTRAHALYRAAGFRDVGPWEGFPEHLKTVAVFMEMTL